MDFYDVVKSRRTIRDFSDKKVDKETIERVLSTGLMAPTNDHLRNWEFVIILEKEIIEKIINPIRKAVPEESVDFIIDSWKVNAPYQKEMYKDALPKQYNMLIQSECLILPFFKQESPLLEPENLSALNAFASIWCCIENIILAVTAEKLGYAMRIPFEQETETIFEIIKHPKEYFMPCFLAIGYPLPNIRKPEQLKRNVTEKIHYNKW
jgi:nitroreductase